MNRVQHIGYALNNLYGKNNYRQVENYECQFLCQITEGCYYYNYLTQWKECSLKYGMGKAQESKHIDGYWNSGGIWVPPQDINFDESYVFGHKNSPNVTVDVDCEVVFTSCSVTCGDGVRNRFIITDQRGGGKFCSEMEQTCNEGPCPCEWSQWSKCSMGTVTCGEGQGERTRHPIPTREKCQGSQTETCNLNPCNVDCKYEWSHWSSCKCSEGKQTRKMYITVPAEHGGRKCPENMEDEKKCDGAECSTDSGAGSAGTVGAVVGMLLILIILVVTAGGYYFYKKLTIKHMIESNHQVLFKDDRLKDKLKELTENPSVLFREFQQLETEVRKAVSHTALMGEMNQPHNRYGNIGMGMRHRVLYF